MDLFQETALSGSQFMPPALPEVSDWDRLIAKSLISTEDVRPLQEGSTETNRNWISMSPGLGVSYPWSAERAKQLDRDGAFVREVKERIREGTETWGEVPDFCRE